MEAAACPAEALTREHRLRDGRTVVIRPVRADDEPGEHRFFDGLSGDARYMRFQKSVRKLSDKLIHAFTHIDYDRHMAFVCVAQENGRDAVVGEARYIGEPDGRSCELGIVIADRWHRTGIAGLLMHALIAQARAHGFREMVALVLSQNHEMLRFVRRLGFQLHLDPADRTLMRAVKAL